MSIWRHTLVRRLGFWALLQALPSESALKTYLKSVFLALCSAIIAAILTGALITVGMIVLYEVMIMNGIEGWIAGLSVTGAGVLILVAFVSLFFKAIRKMVVIQNTEELRETSFKSPANRIMDAVRTGWTAGYSN